MTGAQISDVIQGLNDFYKNVNVTSELALFAWKNAFEKLDYNTTLSAFERLVGNKEDDRIRKGVSPIAVLKEYYELELRRYSAFDKPRLTAKQTKPQRPELSLEAQAFMIFLKRRFAGQYVQFSKAGQAFNHEKLGIEKEIEEAKKLGETYKDIYKQSVEVKKNQYEKVYSH